MGQRVTVHPENRPYSESATVHSVNYRVDTLLDSEARGQESRRQRPEDIVLRLRAIGRIWQDYGADRPLEPVQWMEQEIKLLDTNNQGAFGVELTVGRDLFESRLRQQIENAETQEELDSLYYRLGRVAEAFLSPEQRAVDSRILAVSSPEELTAAVRRQVYRAYGLERYKEMWSGAEDA